jgi:hypothetical protein
LKGCKKVCQGRGGCDGFLRREGYEDACTRKHDCMGVRLALKSSYLARLSSFFFMLGTKMATNMKTRMNHAA